jgi:CheY-like chemotaxis protein
MLTMTFDAPSNRMENTVSAPQSCAKLPPILVVDDDEDMRLLLRCILEKGGYSVVTAHNGQQCLEAYEHFCPVLVILDAQMPGMDGFTCCQRLRSLPGGADIPILMLTAESDDESRQQAFATGVTDFMTKPYKIDVLLARVRCLLMDAVQD